MANLVNRILAEAAKWGSLESLRIIFRHSQERNFLFGDHTISHAVTVALTHQRTDCAEYLMLQLEDLVAFLKDLVLVPDKHSYLRDIIEFAYTGSIEDNTWSFM